MYVQQQMLFSLHLTAECKHITNKVSSKTSETLTNFNILFEENALVVHGSLEIFLFTWWVE